MIEYVIRRLIQAIPAILGVTIVVFVLLHASGDPIGVMLGPDATDADRALLRQAYQLDKPLYVQYLAYLSHVVRGDFGISLAYGIPAAEVIAKRLPATVLLTVTAMFISLVVGIPAGVIAALKRNTIFDYLIMLGAVVGQAFARFWLGLILILVFAVNLRWLPTSGMGSGITTVKHLILPALTLSPWLMALSARLVRSGMLEVLRQDYIRTAYAKGLPLRLVLIRHALRNALIPVINITGLSLAYLMGGAIIVEIIFAWPGIGTLVYRSVLNRDYNIVLGVVTIVATTFVLVNILVDIIVAIVDPRIRIKLGGTGT